MVGPPHGSIVAKGEVIHKRKGGAVVAPPSMPVIENCLRMVPYIGLPQLFPFDHDEEGILLPLDQHEDVAFSLQSGH